MNGTHENAEAGPSTQPMAPPNASASISAESSPLFLPPPGPPPPPVFLRSTQDLLGRFLLLPAYDKYVRPAYSTTDTDAAMDHIPSTPGMDKGKGREVVPSPAAQTPGNDGQDGDDDEGGKGEKKKKNSYKHLIKGVPGKHSMKKDDYLMTMMQVPPKQRIPITPFDARTQREAFSVSLEGLKGWNPSALVLESAQAREDRKKRKELKRLAKAQAQAHAQSQVASTNNSQATSTPAPAPFPVPLPTPAALTSNSVSRTMTPRPAIPRPGSTPRPSLAPVHTALARASTPLRTATPTSAHPLRTSTPAPTPTSVLPPNLAMQGTEKRGKKRERDDSNGNVHVNSAVHPTGFAPAVNGANGTNVVPVASASTPKAIVGAKAGTAGVRPRPLKKQRMDIQGQGRDVTAVQQQPTPQGV